MGAPERATRRGGAPGGGAPRYAGVSLAPPTLPTVPACSPSPNSGRGARGPGGVFHSMEMNPDRRGTQAREGGARGRAHLLAPGSLAEVAVTPGGVETRCVWERCNAQSPLSFYMTTQFLVGKERDICTHFRIYCKRIQCASMGDFLSGESAFRIFLKCESEPTSNKIINDEWASH